MPNPLPLTIVDAALRGTLLALLLLLACVLLRDRPALAAARAGAAMCVGLCVQVVGSTPAFEAQVPRLWQAPLVGVAVANAVLFWVLVQALFDDDFTLRPLHALAWAAVFALGAFNCAVLAGSASVVAPFSRGLQRGVPLLFAALAAVAAGSGWRADLVEKRRWLRGFILLTGVAYTLAMLAVRLASPQGRMSGTAALADVAALLLMTAVSALRLLRLTDADLGDLFPSAAARQQRAAGSAAAAAGTPIAPPLRPAMPNGPGDPGTPARAAGAADPADERLAVALQRVMSVEQAYCAEDLSVASLAARLAVPEYRLRRLINQRLGHRNFNAYVNGLRLDQACAALADPAQRGTPVLTVALEAGFQSIGPFNRAFKAATGLTPTEYRRQKLADS